MRIFGLSGLSTQRTSSSLWGVLLITLNVASVTAAYASDEYGDVTGRIILQGEAPKLRPLFQPGDLKVRDAALCGALNIPNDGLVVHRENRGIQNIFVYLKRIDPDNVHPELRKSTHPHVSLQLKNCRMAPHTMVVHTDQQVILTAGSDLKHNVHPYPIFNNQFGPFVRPTEPGQPITVARFKMKEPLPIQVKCDIHAWMQAYWLVSDHPYAATTDADGRFTIEKLPAGEHSLTIWHERVGYIEKSFNVRVQNEKQADIGNYEVSLDRFKLKDRELETSATPKS
jgi:hypothetical protein